MRKLLKQQEGRRGEFRATVAQFGTKSAFRGPDLPTMLLKDVKESYPTKVRRVETRWPARSTRTV